jgi:alkaline phosphatase D
MPVPSGVPLSRRTFLGAALAMAIAAACGDDDGPDGASPGPGGPDEPGDVPDLPSGIFSLGVASGDPLSDSVILWTRLVPEGDAALPDEDIPVRWTVASDEALTDVVTDGSATARAGLAHSVHVDATGLEPDRHYWYRFEVGDQTSPVGRTRTAPAEDEVPDRLRFVFASCQNWESGYYAAYRHIVADDPDLVIFLGDYIYEYGPGEYDQQLPDERVMPLGRPTDLAGYRDRYAVYKADPELQAAHAAAPWMVIWDDHEVDNNYADDIDQSGARTPEEFLELRAAAYQAWYEHLPVRLDPPDGPELRIHRRLEWGGLASISLLDTRQYRDNQPCDVQGDFGPGCPERTDERSLLGDEQEEWLIDGLATSTARWNVIAQQMAMAELNGLPGSELGFFNFDAWDGYPTARRRILDALADGEVSNPVVLSGDFHLSWVSDLKPDFGDPSSPVVATELGGTSITSPSNIDDDLLELAEAAMPQLEWVRFAELRRRGYVRCDVTADVWRADYQLLEHITSPDAPIETVASFEIRDGVPGARQI